MYESFYGLTRRPFSATPDADCFVPVDTMQQALTELLLCLHGGQGVAVLSAPAGTGKTLLCRKIAAELQDAFQTALLPSANFPTRRSLLQAILYELQHPYARMGDQELRLELTTAVRQVRSSSQGVVLILDEAHLLSERLFEELRGITNLAHVGEPLVRVLLSGQLSLEEKLMAPGLSAFNQRVACQVTLQPLTRLESAEYIRHRLGWAGGNSARVFTREAVQLIGHASDGLPRCLNQLCDHSLLLGYVAEEKPVGAATVREALQDLKQLPLHWNVPVPVAAPLDQLKRKLDDCELASSEAERHELAEVNAPAEPRTREVTDFDEPFFAEPDPIESEELNCIEIGAGSVPDARLEPDAAQSAAANRPPSETTRATPPSRMPAAERQFEEELVIDRYGMLEAGLPFAATGSGQTPPADQPASATTTAASEDVIHESIDGQDDDIPATAEIESILDDVLPLIDEALHDDDVAAAPQRTAIREFEPPEQLPPPTWAPEVVETDATGDEHRTGIDLEDEIGAAVLDACLDVQQGIERWTEDVDPVVDDWVDSESSATHLEPYAEGPDASVPGEPHIPFGNAARRQRKYERLFSELQRRRRGA